MQKSLKMGVKKMESRPIDSTIKIAMLSAVAFILMLFEFPIPIFPEFLKIELSDVPAVIGTFSLGPLAGVLIELLKNLLKFVVASQTGGIGEFFNFIIGIAYIIPLGVVYKFNQNRKGIITGSVLASLIMVLIASVCNYYIFIPVYATLFGMPIEGIVQWSSQVNPAIQDLKSLVALSVVPFNLLKVVIVSLISYKLYTVMEPLFKKLTKRF